jgi:hypothetical protein
VKTPTTLTATKEHHSVSYRVRSPHRLVLVLFALAVNFLLYNVFYSIFRVAPDRAAEVAALAAFFIIVVVSFALKSFLEE